MKVAEAAKLAMEALGNMDKKAGAGELEAAEAKVAELQEQVEALQKMKAKKKGEHTKAEIDHLKELMANIEAIEKESTSAKSQDNHIQMAQAMAEAMKARKEKEEQQEKAPLQQNSLHACTLLAARHYCDPNRNKAPAKGSDASTSKEEALQGPMAATEVRSLLERFAAGKKAAVPLDVGDVAYATVFRGIAACLNWMDQDRLEEFHAAGGFEITSSEALDEQLVNEAEGKKTAMPLTGNVFKLGFDKAKWSELRRIVARYYGQVATEAAQEATTGKDEL